MKQAAAIILAFIFLFPGTVVADEKIRGKYEVIGDINKLKGAKTIKMLEFFNYSCGHCYRFLETSRNFAQNLKTSCIIKNTQFTGETRQPILLWHFILPTASEWKRSSPRNCSTPVSNWA
jgi:hypothetical protein